MKQKTVKKKDEMRAEYDFSDGVRGKHHKALKKGHQTVVTKADGSIVVTETKLIALAPDLQTYFPDSKSVERALRGLVALLPEKH
ncbi:hypothetical protein BH20ACI2_BH20ACI2_22360 [soil metagenome]